ncbi:MAG: hypothetical protein F4X48_02485 [Acidimicrobiia bacterium]|nr:hypothetical protein [Acidimicrobiia bacterium]
MLALLGLTGLTMGLLGCGNGEQPSLDAFCERLETAFGPQGALADDYSNNAARTQAVMDELESIRRVAPLEIEPSLAVVHEAVGLIIASFNDPSGTQIDSQKLQNSEMAAAQLNRYSVQNCDLELRWENPVLLLNPDRIPGEISLEVRG